jgi:hypothetical protein
MAQDEGKDTPIEPKVHSGEVKIRVKAMFLRAQTDTGR